MSEDYFHLIDVMPTLCDLAETNYPREYNGNRIKPSEGVSLLPHIRGEETKSSNRSIYWQHENHSAIRAGDWKMIEATAVVRNTMADTRMRMRL